MEEDFIIVGPSIKPEEVAISFLPTVETPSHYKMEIDQLEKEVKQLKERTEIAESELFSARQKIQELTETNDSLTSLANILNENISSHSLTFEEDKLKEKEEEIRSLRDEIRVLKMELEEKNTGDLIFPQSSLTVFFVFSYFMQKVGPKTSSDASKRGTSHFARDTTEEDLTNPHRSMFSLKRPKIQPMKFDTFNQREMARIVNQRIRRKLPVPFVPSSSTVSPLGSDYKFLDSSFLSSPVIGDTAVSSSEDSPTHSSRSSSQVEEEYLE